MEICSRLVCYDKSSSLLDKEQGALLPNRLFLVVFVHAKAKLDPLMPGGNKGSRILKQILVSYLQTQKLRDRYILS